MKYTLEYLLNDGEHFLTELDGWGDVDATKKLEMLNQMESLMIHLHGSLNPTGGWSLWRTSVGPEIDFYSKEMILLAERDSVLDLYEELRQGGSYTVVDESRNKRDQDALIVKNSRGEIVYACS